MKGTPPYEPTRSRRLIRSNDRSGLPRCEGATNGKDVILRFMPPAEDFEYPWLRDVNLDDVVPQTLDDVLADVERNNRRRFDDLDATDR